jgi:hypothetical protein
VSNPVVIQQFIDGLSPEQRARCSQLVLPGEDHNLGIAYLYPRLALIGKLACQRV